jgi:hypothetical protein
MFKKSGYSSSLKGQSGLVVMGGAEEDLRKGVESV